MISSYVNVNNWQNVVAVQISDESVVALTDDGTLLSSWGGVLTTNVVQFASLGTKKQVVAVRTDGSVYGSDDTLQNAVSEWSEIVAVDISNNGQISAVNKDNELLRYENGTYQTVGSGYVGFWSGNPVSIDSSRLMETSGTIKIWISFSGDEDGTVGGGITDQEVAARKFVRDYTGHVGYINPDAMTNSK